MKPIDIVEKRYRSILFIDFETRSRANLQDEGSHKYCRDGSTTVLLTAYAIDNQPVNVVEFGVNDEVNEALLDPTVLKIAHNAEFDMGVLTHVLGYPLDYSEWFDTAFQAAYYGHPRKLEYLARRLGVTQKNAQDGVYFFSIPKKQAKGAEVIGSPFNEPVDHPDEWEAFKVYAAQDVGTMREAFYAMNGLPEIEIEAMQLTFDMNFNGVPFDVPLSVKIYKRAYEYETEASNRAKSVYCIENLRSPKQVQDALQREGVNLQSLNKKLRGGVEHEILDLRDIASGTAFAKIPKAIKRLCFDGRLHGELIGNGAHTGRWSSRGVQLQNWAKILDEVNENLINIKSYEHLKQHMRLCLGHVPNMSFTFADLSQIEARIVAWLAGCKWRMEAFEAGVDIYARSAEKMFNIPKVNKGDKERQYGKCAELGLGYGGGIQAINNIQPDFYREVGAEKVQDLVNTWRNANPEIKRLWFLLEQAMRESIRTGQCAIRTGEVILKFQYDGKTGRIILPSGRALYYRGLHLAKKDVKSTELVYLDYSRGGEHPVMVRFWGGTLLENITQAIARDVLVDDMRRVKLKAPYASVLCTVHDEIWYNHETRYDLLPTLLDEMAAPISWAPGLVTKGDGCTSDRYRK